MATKKKKANARKSAARRSPDTNADSTTTEREDTATASGHGAATTEHPEGVYESLSDLPDFHRGYAHPDAESYVIVPQHKQDEALREGVAGQWTATPDGHFVVSVGVGGTGNTSDEFDDDEDDDGDNDNAQ